MMISAEPLLVRRHMGFQQLVAILIGASLTFGMFSGCSSRKAVPEDGHAPEQRLTDDKVTPPVEFEASLDCLTRSANEPGDVPWDVARTLGEFSYIAYEEPDEQKSAIKLLGATFVTPMVRGSSHGVVASNDQVVVIAFRGTKNAADWLTDARITGHRVADGSMHRGFHEAVDALFNDVYEEAVKQGARDKAVWVTGHSLGGAMAVGFAYRAIIEKSLVADGVITFGQPLVFTESLAQVMLDKYDTRYIRFVNNWDPVTRLLPTYRHAGARVHLSGDEYTIRRPSIAVSAPAPGTAGVPIGGPPNVVGFAEEEDLQPMTEAEFVEFQKRLQAEQGLPEEAPPVSTDRPFVAGALPIPFITPHLMGTYRDRLKAVAEKNRK